MRWFWALIFATLFAVQPTLALNGGFGAQGGGGSGGGSGSVTSFSSGDLSPLFTTSVADPTTTPAQTFAQVSQNQNLFFASPNGSSGNPTFRAILVADLPLLTTAVGGTGLSSYTAGDMLYYTTGTALSNLAIGTANQVLRTNAGATAPEWASLSAGTGLSLTALQFSLSTPVSIANGGTNNGSLAVTAGGMVYTDGTKLMNTGAGTSAHVMISAGAGAPAFGQLNLAGAGVTGTLPQGNGGTGQSSYTAGDILVVNDSGNIVKLAGGTDTHVLTYDSSQNPNVKWAAASGGGAIPGLVNGRLTLTSGTAITTADVTSTSVYFTPINGYTVTTLDSGTWTSHTFTEKTLALGTLTADKNYDIWGRWNAGDLELSLSSAWASDTARTDAIEQRNGVWVKDGGDTENAYLLLGTIRTISTTQTRDGEDRRYVSNVYNRVNRRLFAQITTDNWSYGSTIRAANADTTDGSGRFSWVDCLGDITLVALLNAFGEDGGGSVSFCHMGLDATANHSNTTVPGYSGTALHHGSIDTLKVAAGLGRHYIQRTEEVSGASSTTFRGVYTGHDDLKTGMHTIVEPRM